MVEVPQYHQCPHTSLFRLNLQSHQIQTRTPLLCFAQMSQQSALQCDDDIFHLLSGDRVPFLVASTKLLSMFVILTQDFVVTACERPFQVPGGLVCSTAIVPFVPDCCENATAVIVGGDNYAVSVSGERSTQGRSPVPAATQATTAITSAPDIISPSEFWLCPNYII